MVRAGQIKNTRNDRMPLRLPEDQVKQGLALFLLLILTTLAIAGPTGLLAWSENARMLEQRNAHIAVLEAERDRLQNRVELLNPDAADPDLIMELMRRNLNVVHPDELVINPEEQ